MLVWNLNGYFNFQYYLIVKRFFFFILKGIMVVGGILKVVEINKDLGRLDMFEYV